MKKVFFAASLAAVVAGSWAFYPKPADQTGYLMIVSRFSNTPIGGKATVAVTMPGGQPQTEEVEAKIGTLSKIASTFDQLHLLELQKLNTLRTQGWRLVSATQMSTAGATTETVYVMEKQ